MSTLLGLPRQVRRRIVDTGESISVQLANALPKPLAEELCHAIGIELPKPVEHDDAYADDDGAVFDGQTIAYSADIGDVSKGVAPSLIARAHLFTEMMLSRDLSAKGRFDSIYGTGAADRVLSGR